MVYYNLDLAFDNNEIRRFVFLIERENRQRWADMRLIQIQDKNSQGVRVDNYNPDIHLPTGHHYMSRCWKARFIWLVEYDDGGVDVEGYWLINPFGNPRTKMLLYETDTIRSLEDE